MCFWSYLADVQGQTWAAWVQAIGSIAAIWMTAKVVRTSHELERQRAIEAAKNAHLEMLRSAEQLVGATRAICDKIYQRELNSAAPMAERRVMLAELTIVNTALQKCDPMSFSSYPVAESVLVTLATSTVLIANLERTMTSNWRNSQDPYFLRNAAHHALQVVDARLTKIENHIATL